MNGMNAQYKQTHVAFTDNKQSNHVFLFFSFPKTAITLKRIWAICILKGISFRYI
jgi:hypothetical protein